jgi:pimeloyl-ACP methyl ester carboxylesterase
MRLATQRILQEIMANPSRIIHGYRQVIGDARSLIRVIRQGFHPYWTQLFPAKAEISLFGYSLGGFAALALLLLNPDQYRSVFLLESGAFIDQIDAGILFLRSERTQRVLWEAYREKGDLPDPQMELLFSKRERTQNEAFERARNSSGGAAGEEKRWSGEEPWRVFERTEVESRKIWRDIVTTLYTAIDTEGILLTGAEAQVFRRILLGYQSLIYKQQLADLSDKILIIVGGADEIFPAKLLLSQGPDTGLALLQIPGITHWIKYRSREQWRHWRNLVINLMETFNRIHPDAGDN